MINYYYELAPDVTVFGRKDLQYLAHFDVHPGRANGINWTLHDEALRASTRVWMENANGVRQIKPTWTEYNSEIRAAEFTWIKLKCQDIEDLR